MGITLPLPVGRTGYYLRDMVSADAVAYQNIHEALKEAGQYYAFLKSFGKINPDGSIDGRDIGSAFVARALASQTQSRDTYRLALCNPNHDVVGYAIILNSPDDRRAQYGFEIGYFMHPRYQGRNLATLSLAALIEEVTEKLGLKSFYGTSHPANEASSRVLKKLGMRFRETCILKDDVWHPERFLYTGDIESFASSPARHILLMTLASSSTESHPA